MPQCDAQIRNTGYRAYAKADPGDLFEPDHPGEGVEQSNGASIGYYDAYTLWCEDNACHRLSASRLSSELAQNEALYNVEYTNNIYLSGGRRVRGFMGIEVIRHGF